MYSAVSALVVSLVITQSMSALKLLNSIDRVYNIFHEIDWLVMDIYGDDTDARVDELHRMTDECLGQRTTMSKRIDCFADRVCGSVSEYTRHRICPTLGHLDAWETMEALANMAVFGWTFGLSKEGVERIRYIVGTVERRLGRT